MHKNSIFNFFTKQNEKKNMKEEEYIPESSEGRETKRSNHDTNGSSTKCTLS